MKLKPLPRRFNIRLRLLPMLVLILMVNMSVSGTLAEQHDDDGAWFQVPPAFHGIGGFSGVKLHDGRILVSIDQPLIYNPHLGNWQEGPPHPEIGSIEGWSPRAAVQLPDGRILVAGGSYSTGISPGSTRATGRAAIYDPVAADWLDVAPMNDTRLNPTLTVLDDGSVLAAGGEYGGGVGLASGWDVHRSVERYHPDHDQWEPAGELTAAGNGHTAVRLSDGSVLFAGGAGPERSRSTIAEIYDPVSGDWEVVTDQLPDTLYLHASQVLDGDQVLFLGGSTSNELGGVEDPVDSVFIFNAHSGEQDPLAPMSIPRMRHAVAGLSNGEILVTGGTTISDSDHVDTSAAEALDPGFTNWRPVASMTQARARHHAFELPGGEASQGADVYVIGGVSPSEIPVPTEVFYIREPGPFDRQPPPSSPHPSFRYFTETGQYLAWGFRNFWEQNGGLPVFGFPLSSEFGELNPDLDELRISQYFERQRFEYHPEHAGPPYEVQLGRLGVVDAQNRELLDHEAFVPVDDAPDGCHYFSETGHTLCGVFQSYWDQHGLDFGDPGVSYRESLALFGYPISEEFVDPDSGLTVQYLERARFEHHPDNPEQHQVLLGRLAADLIGWDNE